jgi:hypothetical protein
VAAHADALDALFRAIKSSLPELVTAARQESSDREAVVAARIWWRAFRQRVADKADAEAQAMPEFLLDLGEGE